MSQMSDIISSEFLNRFSKIHVSFSACHVFSLTVAVFNVLTHQITYEMYLVLFGVSHTVILFPLLVS